MITNELLQFIKDQRAKGISDETIKAKLVGNTWNASDVNEAYQALGVAPPPMISPQVFTPAKKSSSVGTKVIFVAVLIVLLSAGGAFAYYKIENTAAPMPVAPTADTSIPAPQVSSNPTVPSSIPPTTEVPVSTPQSSSSQTSSSAATSYTNTQYESSTSTSGFGTNTIGGDVTTTISCGTATCFDADFTTCTPANETSAVPPLGTFSITILGPVTGGCSVKLVYTKNPNPAWVNQPMTCTMDNTKDFETEEQEAFTEAIEGAGSCTGPFVQVLQTPPPDISQMAQTQQPAPGDSEEMYLDSNGITTSEGLQYVVKSITANQAEISITQTATGEVKTMTLVPGQQTALFGFTFTLVGISSENTGTSDGQQTSELQALLKIVKQ